MAFAEFVAVAVLAGSLVLHKGFARCPTENDLINGFNDASVQLEVYGSDRSVCHIEDDNDLDHEDPNREIEDTNTTSCNAIYQQCRSVIIDLGLTTEDCLEDRGRENDTAGGIVSEAEAYGYGFLMVIFVSLCSLGGVLLVPLIKSNSETGKCVYDHVYSFMIAIAISALVSDALLHLIPHAFGLHAHEEESKEFIWKACVALLGIYGFYLLEFFLHTCGHDHYVKEMKSKEQNPDSVRYHCPADDVHYSSSIPRSDINGTELISNQDSNTATTELTSVHGRSKKIKIKPVASDDVHYTSSIPRPNASYSEEEKEQDQDTEKIVKGGKKLKIKPVAWLIIIGDCVHNFADGIALGAAISQSLSLGLSTMFALVFHELPHEFGDFVILVKSGFHWRVALLINFLQSLTAVVGLLIGVAISTKSDSASNWILSLTAGLFFYIALTDLLPDLIHGGGHNQMKTTRVGLQRWDGIIRFSLINLGFLLAFAILLILAIYEENLNNLF